MGSHNLLILAVLALGVRPSSLGVPPPKLTSLPALLDGDLSPGRVSVVVVDEDLGFVSHAAVLALVAGTYDFEPFVVAHPGQGICWMDPTYESDSSAGWFKLDEEVLFNGTVMKYWYGKAMKDTTKGFFRVGRAEEAS